MIFSHFKDEEINAQREEVLSPRSPQGEVAEMGLDQVSDLSLLFFASPYAAPSCLLPSPTDPVL